ncbi:hypothetical protein [Tenacibaculum amylolyticum]|uniref:hypothetical protein n=1 Tax=Tenacibaculum amylolyticum TaxID=104269 RepID=UPI0038943AE1
MIKNTDHCRLCEYQEAYIQKGIICSLNNLPPAFSRTCSKKLFNTIAIEKTTSISQKYKELNESRLTIYLNIIFWPIIGILVLYADYLYYQHYIKPYDILTKYGPYGYYCIPILIILFCVGIILIGKGTGPYFEYKKEKEVAFVQKKRLDQVFQLYGIRYIVTYYPKRNFLDTRIMVKDVKLETSSRNVINLTK